MAAAASFRSSSATRALGAAQRGRIPHQGVAAHFSGPGSSFGGCMANGLLLEIPSGNHGLIIIVHADTTWKPSRSDCARSHCRAGCRSRRVAAFGDGVGEPGGEQGRLPPGGGSRAVSRHRRSGQAFVGHQRAAAGGVAIYACQPCRDPGDHPMAIAPSQSAGARLPGDRRSSGGPRRPTATRDSSSIRAISTFALGAGAAAIGRSSARDARGHTSVWVCSTIT